MITYRSIEIDADGIQDFFSNSDEPSLLGYHSPSYLRILAKIIPCQVGYLAAFSAIDQMIGLMPYAISVGTLGPVLNALPFFGINSTLAALDAKSSGADEIRRGLLHQFDELAKQRKVISKVLYTPLFTNNPETLADELKVDFRIKKFTLCADLRNPHIWPKKRQADIRRAIDFGFTVRPGSTSDLEPLWNFYSTTCAELGIPLKPKEFLQLTLKESSPDGPIHWLVAEFNGQVTGGLLCVRGPKTISYTLPISDPTLRQHQSNALLIDHIVKLGLAKGAMYFNFESSPQREDAVYLYKERWGAKELLYEIWGNNYSQALVAANESLIRAEYPYFFVKPFNRITGTL